MDETLRPELEAGLRQLGLDTALAGPLLAYLALLARWNQTYNLTAIRDTREMLAKHLLDSLAMLGGREGRPIVLLSLIHISEPTRPY